MVRPDFACDGANGCYLNNNLEYSKIFRVGSQYKRYPPAEGALNVIKP